MKLIGSFILARQDKVRLAKVAGRDNLKLARVAGQDQLRLAKVHDFLVEQHC